MDDYNATLVRGVNGRDDVENAVAGHPYQAMVYKVGHRAIPGP